MDQITGKPLGAVRQFLTGAGLLGRGLGLVLRSPKLLGLGLLPAADRRHRSTRSPWSLLIDFLPQLSRGVTWLRRRLGRPAGAT